MEGYIYILFNRAYHNQQLKIGMTTKAPETRADELSRATGVPREFEVLYEQRVSDCARAERLLHERLRKYRSASNREFFNVSTKIAIRLLEDVADEVGRADDVQEDVATEISADEEPVQTGEMNAVAPAGLRRGQRKIPAHVTFEDHASYTDAVRRPILNEIRSRVLRLDERLRDTERCTPGHRIAYKLPGGKVFLEVKVQRAAIVLHLADGGCPDPSRIADDIPASHGWRQLKKRVTIESMADLEAATPFIVAAYHARP
jgi:predicted transport protein